MEDLFAVLLGTTVVSAVGAAFSLIFFSGVSQATGGTGSGWRASWGDHGLPVFLSVPGSPPACVRD